jgi:hypothetical protein
VVGSNVVDRQRIADEQFLSCGDIDGCFDEHAALNFECSAVSIARVIKPSRAVATSPTVDNAPIGQSELEGMPCAHLSISVCSPAPADHFAFVFEHPFASNQRTQRKYTSSMHRRSPDAYPFHMRLMTIQTGEVYAGNNVGRIRLSGFSRPLDRHVEKAVATRAAEQASPEHQCGLRARSFEPVWSGRRFRQAMRTWKYWPRHLQTEPDALFVPPRWVELEQPDAKSSNPSLYNFGRRAKLGRRVRERSVL